MADTSKSLNSQRSRYLVHGVWLSLGTISWNIIEGIVAIAAGLIASSVALIGFGIDSFIETSSAFVVGWRLLEELRGSNTESVERFESLASKVAGSLLILLSVYVCIDAVRRLIGFGAEAQESVIGIALTVISLIVMPLLAKGKLATAEKLGSKALKIDAQQTICCFWLSLTTLIGLSLNALCGWWWADPVAALILVPLIAKEGLEGFQDEPCCSKEC